MQREREISDFARRGERRPAVDVSGSDCASDIAKLDDRARDRLREQETDDQRSDKRKERRYENIAPSSADNLTKLRGRNRNTNETERMLDGAVELVVASGGAPSARAPDASSVRVS